MSCSPTRSTSAIFWRSFSSDPDFTRVIVFTRTKHGANRVAETLEKSGFTAEAIHGNKSQNARQRALARFKSGEAPILVATDIAARGIDVDDISHVINFELPNEPESYVHRIGRTARAGASGVAISLVDGEERGLLKQIERITRQSIKVMEFALDPELVRQIEAQRSEPRRNEGRPGGHRGAGRPAQNHGKPGGGKPAFGKPGRGGAPKPARGNSRPPQRGQRGAGRGSAA